MSLEKSIQDIVIAKLQLNAYIAVNGTPVRAWTDNTVNEGKTQVIVRAEITEIAARDATGKVKAYKIKAEAAARTYAAKDKDLVICDALYSAVYAVMESLVTGDFSTLVNGTVNGLMSEPPETSLDDTFNARIASKSLMVSI